MTAERPTQPPPSRDELPYIPRSMRTWDEQCEDADNDDTEPDDDK